MLVLDEKHLTGLVEDKLITILGQVSGYVGALVITSLHREGDKGVHGTIPCRGIDVRSRDNTIARSIARVVNDAWVYDPSRPDKQCAIPHDVGFGLHLHLQVHPNTRRR